MKTAIEWLVEEIKTLIDNGYVFNPKWEQPMIEEAIEMEKEQMRSANCPFIGGWEEGEFEDWYNETFNK